MKLLPSRPITITQDQDHVILESVYRSLQLKLFRRNMLLNNHVNTLSVVMSWYIVSKLKYRGQNQVHYWLSIRKCHPS